MPLHAEAKTFHTDAVFPKPLASGSGPASLPDGGLVADAQGRLYGATTLGGTADLGTIYRLTPGAAKSDPWTTEILHSFTGMDGDEPNGRLYIDASGAIFGTTEFGGSFSGQGNGAGGVAYRLDNLPGWPITILHNFGDQADGSTPLSSLAPGKNGLLYGTTFEGGAFFGGTAFAISPLGDSVSYQVIHSFSGPPDSTFPTDITIQGDGAIYGLSRFNEGSAVFRLVEKSGVWRERLIYKLAGIGDQLSSILLGPDGVLFTCSYTSEGSYAIQLSPPPSSGFWTKKDLYAFGRNQGCTSLTINPSGGFIGTSSSGGSQTRAGSLLSLTQPAPDGAYTLRTLHRFSHRYEDPTGSLLRIGGLYYGATAGADNFGGEVFDIRP